MPDGLPARVCEFGPFRYDPAQRLLFRAGVVVPLAPKAIDTLHALLARRGQVVEKAELMKLVWPDCVVEEVGLARNISLLRQALGSDGEAYVETVPRRGYRFAPAEDEATDPLPVVKRRAIPAVVAAACAGALLLAALVYWQFYQPSRFAPARGERALMAVATLQSISPELERTAFSMRFTDTLVGEIVKLDSVQLISPSTVRRYERQGIPTALMGRLLGLHVIVEGTAQQFGSHVRIALRMSDVHSGRLIWAESYDCPSGDPASAESSVARAAAEQIGRHLSH